MKPLASPEHWHVVVKHRGAFADCWYCQRSQAHCRSKIRFATREEADEWVRERNDASAWASPVVRYPCRWCLGYHMARPKGKQQIRRVERHRRKWLVRQSDLRGGGG